MRQRAETVVELPTTATTCCSSPAAASVRAEDGQRVHQSGVVDHQGRIVVLPTGLVLLRAPMVVDADDGATDLPCRGTEVDRRLPAVGPDLQHDAMGQPLPGQPVEQQSLCLGHEPRGRPGTVEQVVGHAGGLRLSHGG